MKTQKITVVELQQGSFHFFTTIKINDKRCRFLIDTGASVCVIDKEYFEKTFQKNTRKLKVETTSLHSTQSESNIATVKKLELLGFVLKNKKLAALDLSHVNKNYKNLNVPKIHGILGADVLLTEKMVLDFDRMVMYKTVEK